jgi:hypothetical protein
MSAVSLLILTGSGVGSGGVVGEGKLSGVGVTVFSGVGSSMSSAVGEIASVGDGGVTVAGSSTAETVSDVACVVSVGNVAVEPGSAKDSIDGNSKSEHATSNRPTNSNRRSLLKLLLSTAIITLLHIGEGKDSRAGYNNQPVRYRIKRD